MGNKKQFLHTLFFVALFAVLPAMAQEKHPLIELTDSFRGIKPYVTTRAEVEKKLGKPNELNRYQFEDGRVHVIYRESICDSTSKNWCPCGIPQGTVVLISVMIEYALKIEDLKLDPAEWKEIAVTGGHDSGQIAFVNEKIGVTIYTWQDKEVTSIDYRVTDKTCQEVKKRIKARISRWRLITRM